MDDNKKNSLIICMTPLQMLIAEKIIALKPEEDFVVLVITFDLNEKYLYYYQKISKLVSSSYFFEVKSTNKFSRLFDIIRLKWLFRNNKLSAIENCYIATINSQLAYVVISILHNPTIFTFDDGVANVFQNGIYFKERKYTVVEKCIRYLLNIHVDMEIIRQKTKLHYTIYKKSNNISKKIKFISLGLDISNMRYNNFNNNLPKVNIFLGQPLKEIGLALNENELFNILKTYKIDFYFPHPRENRRYESIPYIETKLIFEDYIINLLQKEDFKKINIYTFLSGAAINVSHISNVKCYFLYNDELLEKYNQLYNYLSQFGDLLNYYDRTEK